jgi:hypothetical protein
MQSSAVSRRGVFRTILAVCASYAVARPGRARAAPAEIKVPDNVPVERVDFEAKGSEGWTQVTGQWTVEEMDGAPSGKRVLVQRATRNPYNVIVAPFGPYTDVDVSMKFKADLGPRGRLGRDRLPIRPRHVLHRPRQRPRGQLPPVLLRPGPPSARHRKREDPSPRTVAHCPRRGRGRPHSGLAQRHPLP